MSTWSAPACVGVLVLFLLSLGFFIPWTVMHWHVVTKVSAIFVGFAAAMWVVAVYRILARLAEMHG